MVYSYFLDISTAQKLGCVLTPIPQHAVTVARGGKLIYQQMCSNFTCQIQGVQFVTDVRVISLGGCDLVLEIQWLKSVGLVTMDFAKVQMQFSHN